jgi:hypothetical protein
VGTQTLGSDVRRPAETRTRFRPKQEGMTST